MPVINGLPIGSLAWREAMKRANEAAAQKLRDKPLTEEQKQKLKKPEKAEPKKRRGK